MVITRNIKGFKIPSVNEIWRRGRYSTYLKESARELKAKLDPIFEPTDNSEKELFNENVNVVLKLGFNTVENKDVDNYAKIPIDSIKTRLIEDDTQIHTLIMMKEKVVGEETLDVEISKNNDSFVAIFSLEDIDYLYSLDPLILNKLILTEDMKYNLIKHNITYCSYLNIKYSTKLRLAEDKIAYFSLVIPEAELRRILRNTDDLDHVEKLKLMYCTSELEETFKRKIMILKRKNKSK
jgi:Holliday junction resolvase RusA-like endonuclease